MSLLRLRASNDHERAIQPPARAIANSAYDTPAAYGLTMVIDVPSRISKTRRRRKRLLLVLLAWLRQLSCSSTRLDR